jgi:ABC-type glycerol-3-phosphate transport system substrate-binding protein
MKTVSTLLILLALFAAGCGSSDTSSDAEGSVSTLTPPAPAGVPDEERPPSPPKL